MVRYVAGALGLLLGGCRPDASGLGSESGEADGSTTAGTTGTATTEAPVADSSGAATMAGSSSAGDETPGSTGPTDTTGASTDEGTSTGGLPADPCPADPALVACYDFAGLRSGTLQDLSGNGNDGTVSAVGVVMGPFGTAATFDARSEIAVPDSASLDITGAHTLEAWIRVDSLPPSGDRAGVLDNEGQYSLIIYDSDEYRCDSAAGTLHAGPVVLGSWTHVACVNDGVSLRLYVDGTEWGSTDAGGPVATDNTDPMSIGDTSPAFDEPLDGAVGGVRVWSTALDAAALCEAAGPACAGGG